jgi:hypothetical protein
MGWFLDRIWLGSISGPGLKVLSLSTWGYRPRSCFKSSLRPFQRPPVRVYCAENLIRSAVQFSKRNDRAQLAIPKIGSTDDLFRVVYSAFEIICLVRVQ